MPSYEVLSAQQAELLIAAETVKILDMRDARSYRAGHIDGAVLLHDGLERVLIEEAVHDLPLLVYCYRGIKSKEKALELACHGFTRVYALAEGFTGWRREREQTEPGGDES